MIYRNAHQIQDYLHKLFLKEGDLEHAHAHSSDLLWKRYVRDVDYISKKIRKGALLLDAGCGAGHISVYLKSIRHDIKIVGIDINKNLSWNMLKGRGCIFKKGNVLKTNFKDCEFDTIIAFGVIEHVNNEKKIGDTKKDLIFLKEMYRILKLRGKIYLVNIPSIKSFTEFLSDRMGIGSHEQKYGELEIRDLAKKSGFNLRNIILRDFIPAQLSRAIPLWEKISNKLSGILFFIDYIVCKTPLNYISQNYIVELEKVS